jgi:hypothetical protein
MSIISFKTEVAYNHLEAAKRFRTELVLRYEDKDPDASVIPLNFRQLTQSFLLFKGINFYWGGDFQRLNTDKFFTKFHQNEGLLAGLFELNGPSRKCNASQNALNADANCSGVTLFHHTSKSPRVGGYFSAFNSLGNQISKEGMIVVLLAEGKPVDSANWEDEEEVAIPGFIFAREVIGFVHQLDYELNSYTKNPHFEKNAVDAWPRAKREMDIEQMQLGISSGSTR